MKTPAIYSHANLTFSLKKTRAPSQMLAKFLSEIKLVYREPSQFTHSDDQEDVVVLTLLRDGSCGKLYGLVQEGGEVSGAVELCLAEGVAVDVQDALCGGTHVLHGTHRQTCRNTGTHTHTYSFILVIYLYMYFVYSHLQ